MSQPTQEEIQNMSPEEIAEMQKKNCIFCKMKAGEIPTYKVYEDELCFAILDINPADDGHVLLLPNSHYQILPQVPNEVLGHLLCVAKKISQAMLVSLGVKGTTILFEIGEAAGQKSPHVLLHLIPRYEGKILLQPEYSKVDPIAYDELLKKLRAQLQYNPNTQPIQKKESPPKKEESEEKIPEKEIKSKSNNSETKKEFEKETKLETNNSKVKNKNSEQEKKESNKGKNSEDSVEIAKDEASNFDLDKISKLFN